MYRNKCRRRTLLFDHIHAGSEPSPVGLAPGRPSDVVAAGPRPGPEPFGPVRPVGFALVGREPRVALDLAADV